jgi:HSP20 family protein
MAMELTGTRPYSLFDQLFQDAFNRAFTPFSGGARAGGSTGYESFPVNVWETNDAYHAAIMAPGLDEQKLNVTVHDGTLTVEGEMAFEMPEGAKIVWQEFGPTHFRRSMGLGSAVEPNRVEAVYRNGILLVTLPKAEHAKPRQIQVQLGSGAGQALPKGSAK